MNHAHALFTIALTALGLCSNHATGKEVLVHSTDSMPRRIDFTSTVYTRDYNAPTTEKEKAIIYYIVTYLGLESGGKVYAKALFNQKKLEREGDKLLNLHPLRFLEPIFTDETLKACVANIYRDAWIWPDFRKGLYKSLDEEYARGNLTPSQIQDFAKIVQVDNDLILPPLLDGDWDTFMANLIEYVPRKGNPGRYDM